MKKRATARTSTIMLTTTPTPDSLEPLGVFMIVAISIFRLN